MTTAGYSFCGCGWLNPTSADRCYGCGGVLVTRRERVEIAVCKALIVLSFVLGAGFLAGLLTVGVSLLAGSPS